MSTETFVLRGTAEWAKVFPDNLDAEFEQYCLDLAIIDEDLPLFVKSGIRSKMKTSKSGLKVCQFRKRLAPWEAPPLTDHPPVVTLKGESFAGPIGNGSKVEVTVSAYDTKFGKGQRLEAVNVIDLVVYEAKPKKTEPVRGPKVAKGDMEDEIPW